MRDCLFQVYFKILDMRLLFIILYVFNVLVIYGQHKNTGRLEIINSVVIKERKQDAVKIEIRLSNFDKETDTLCFCKFHKYIPAIPFVYNSNTLSKYKDSSVGLNYIIEDIQGNIIEARENLPPSFVNMHDELDYIAQRNLVDEKTLKIKKVKLNDKELHEHHLSKFMLAENDTIIILYPMLSSYHDLSTGKYKLYLFYSFNDTACFNYPSQSLWYRNAPNDFMIFKGSTKSNKIDLIIK